MTRKLTDTERLAVDVAALLPHLRDGHVHRQVGHCVYCSCGPRLYQGKPMTAGERAHALTLAQEFGLEEAPRKATGKAGGRTARPPRGNPPQAALPARNIPQPAQKCTSQGCHGLIDWAITVPGGKPMPVDHASAGAAGGNLAVWRKSGKLYCAVLKAGEDLPPGTKRGTPHWATCTSAADHAASKGWSHSPRHHRWELREKAGGTVVAFRHDTLVAEAAADPETWAAFCEAINGAYGVPFPEEPPPQHMPEPSPPPPEAAS